MSADDQFDRRTVIKSSGAAIAGVGAVGMGSSVAAAGSRTISGEIEGVSYTLTVTWSENDCEADAVLQVEGVTVGTAHLTCTNNSATLTFDVGAANGEFNVTLDFQSLCVTASYEVCTVSWSGYDCSTGTETACL